ncbi:MAG TPA: glucose 1-dehydrogenase [Candidatus Binataceae bacterium]|nr:glucose 1-dehydrogenase [Candidatus Binataceae bacterium]
MRGLEDKVAFVTGAGSGIGRAIALRLASEGAKVAVTDLVERAAQSTAAEIGQTAAAITVDVTSPDSVRNGIAQTERLLGPIDVLVNVAGWDKVESFLKSQEETWEKVLAINLKGVFNCVKAILPGMIERGHGRIVSISSDAGRVGSSGEAVYSAAKAGIIGFSKTVAREVARHHINVNVVCPGPTDTPLLKTIQEVNPKLQDALKRAIPFGRLAQPDDIAPAAVFLASDDASYITGQVLSVSGGLTMV